MNKFKKALNQINMNNDAEMPIRRIQKEEQIKEEVKTEVKAVSEPVVTAPEPEPVLETAAEAEKAFDTAAEAVTKAAKKPSKKELKAAKKAEKTAAKKAAKAEKANRKAEKKGGKKAAKAEKKSEKAQKKDDNKAAKKADKAAKKEAKRAKKQEKRKSKGRIFVKIAVIFFIAVIAFGCVWNIHLNNTLRPTFYQVQSSKVVDNVRIVAVSDMHLKEFGENNSKLVKKIQSYHPDLIVMAGDMNMESNPDYSIVSNLCARLHDTAPIYYCLGNHEFDAMLFKESQIYYDLKAMGVKILNNETETVEIGLSKLEIIGLSQGPPQFRQYGAKFFNEAMEESDNFKLVLTHYPENFLGTLNDYDIDLAICGHAHGGQIRLPIIGGLYAADQGLFPKLCDGYHEIDNSKVIITRGLGWSGVIPRINNAPEISVIDINWY